MKLETLKSLKFSSFQTKKISSLKEIIGGTYYLYNTSTHISNGVGDGTDCATWTVNGGAATYDGSCANVQVDPPDPTNVNVSITPISINDNVNNATIMTDLSFESSC